MPAVRHVTVCPRQSSFYTPLQHFDKYDGGGGDGDGRGNGLGGGGFGGGDCCGRDGVRCRGYGCGGGRGRNPREFAEK